MKRQPLIFNVTITLKGHVLLRSKVTAHSVEGAVRSARSLLLATWPFPTDDCVVTIEGQRSQEAPVREDRCYARN